MNSTVKATLAASGLSVAERANVSEAFEDPGLFARVILQSDIWPKQEEILRDLVSHTKVAIKSCHSSGKTFLCALATLFWLMRYDDGKVITTAPGFEQVKRVLWGEIHSAAARSIIPLPEPNQTDLTRESAEGKQNWAVGLSTNTGARFQGFHGGHMLIICDEATGIPGFIWDAIEGIRASGNVTLLMIGNPTFIGGYFFDAFTHPQKSKSWKLHTISAFDTPNFDGFTLDECRALPDDLTETDSIFRHKPRPYLAKRFWAYECLRDYGETSALFQSRVLGEFPQEAEDALIPLRWLQAARKRKVVEDVTAPIRVGIDVAGPGDNETVLQPVQGMNILPLKAWRGLDAQKQVVLALEQFRDNLEVVNYDKIGVGTYFPQPMEAAGFPVVGVDVGKSPFNKEKFFNKRAELYWSLRERFRSDAVAGLVDELTFLQLASIKYAEDKTGHIQIESKIDARKRGVVSPDRADALMLAFGIAEPAMLTYYQNLAKAQAAGEAAPPEPNAPVLAEMDKRPSLGDPPAPAATDDLYTRAAKRLTKPAVLCHSCGKPVEGSRVERGDLKWHVSCARSAGAI